MTNEEQVEALRAQLARQDGQLAEAIAELTLLGEGTTVPFDPAWLRDLDEACESLDPHDACQPLLIGVRA